MIKRYNQTRIEADRAYLDVEHLNGLCEAVGVVREIRRAAGILTARFLEDDALVFSFGGPHPFLLLLVQVVGHDVAFHVVHLNGAAADLAIEDGAGAGTEARGAHAREAGGRRKAGGEQCRIIHHGGCIVLLLDGLCLLGLARLKIGLEA